MTAPKVIWVEPSIAVAGTHGSTAWPDRDDDCISYIRVDAPELLALVEAASALERNLGTNGVNVGTLRVNLAAALAAWETIAPKPNADARVKGGEA